MTLSPTEASKQGEIRNKYGQNMTIILYITEKKAEDLIIKSTETDLWSLKKKL